MQQIGYDVFLPWSVVSRRVGVTESWVTKPGLKSISLNDMIGWSWCEWIAILYPSPKKDKYANEGGNLRKNNCVLNVA